MGRNYKQLSLEDRCEIARLVWYLEPNSFIAPLDVPVCAVTRASLRADDLQGILRTRHELTLLFEQHVDRAEIFPGIIVGDAARQHGGTRCLCVDWEFPEHETQLHFVPWPHRSG
jgi:hypothetical protein